ncbi:MAG TPA: alpha/beta fold hydrolase [Anaerolineae bacterium]|jgi:3-oxoadipate enol-lactonase|nr:alpha/beta fold hydrolase [Anaerolineae bacterium]
MRSGTIEANGQKLYYEVQGQGEPLLVVSGLAGDITSWGLQIEAWREHFQVIAFDNRDAGRSSRATGPYTIAEMAADANAVLDGLSIESAHVLGASMGSMIAQELALAHPGKVRKLVLVCTMAQMSRYAVSFVDPWRWIVNHDAAGEILPAHIITWCMTHSFQQDREAVDTLVQQMLAAPYPQPPEAFGRQADALSNHDALSRLAGIRQPTLVIVGDQDLLTPPWVAREVAEAIPGAQLQVLEGGGHCLFWEIPDRFNQAVIDFLIS